MNKPDIAERSSWLPAPDSGMIPDGHGPIWRCAQELASRISLQLPRVENPWDQASHCVRLEDCSSEFRKILMRSLRASYKDNDLVRRVQEFLSMVSGSFVRDGQLTYELHGNWDSSAQSPRLADVSISHIPEAILQRRSGRIAQVSQPGPNGTYTRIEPIELDPQRIVTFHPPAKYRLPLEVLRTGIPLLWQSENKWMLDTDAPRTQTEQRTAVRAYALQWTKLTAPIGWHHHQRSYDHISSYLVPIYELRWQRFCIEVRDAILTTLAEAFAIIGSWVGEKPRLVWDGLPTVAMVDEAEAKVAAGEVGFLEAMEPFWGARAHT